MKILERRPRSYDRHMDRVSRGKVRSAKEAVGAEVPPGSRVLEIGCGTGELAQILVHRGSTVEGFDLNPGMIAAARERIERGNLEGRLIVREMGVEGMDGLPSNAFDAVVSTLTLSELNPDERRFALKHAHRTLRGGGLIIIGDEVLPRSPARRLIYTLARAPVAAISHLVARGTSRPIEDLAGDLADAGFAVKKEKRSRGDAFAMVVARLSERKQRE